MKIEYFLQERMGLEPDRLKGRYAVVTGGAMGLGKQAALGLACLGADVAVIDKERERLESTVQEVASFGVDCVPIIADMAKDGQLADAVDALLRMWLRTDIFSSNAAQAFIGSYEEETAQQWNQVFNTNLKSITKMNQNFEHRINVHTQELKLVNKKLQEALDDVKQLSGMLPICSNCEQIRDDKGYWNQIETYITQHTDADFSHSICPVCTDELYKGEPWFKGKKKP